MRNFIAFFIIVGLLSCSDGKNEYEKNFISSEYESIVVDMYNDKANHDMNIIKIKIKNDTLKIYSHLYPKIWEYTIIEDSIIKKKGDTFLIVKKKNGCSEKFEMKFR